MTDDLIDPKHQTFRPRSARRSLRVAQAGFGREIGGKVGPGYRFAYPGSGWSQRRRFAIVPACVAHFRDFRGEPMSDAAIGIYAVAAIIAILRTPETKGANLEG